MAKKIYIPTESHANWQRLLAKPDRHWKEGFSAMTLARAWEAAEHTGFPPEISKMLASVDAPELQGLSLLLAIPEFQVDLPGGNRPSQTDVLALASGPEGLVAIAVEGKVDEPFGPTLADKRADASDGAKERMRFLLECLDLPDTIEGAIRYQLLHRTASALLIAKQFYARAAVMLVQSFSPTNKWFSDFEAFAALFKVAPRMGELVAIGSERQGVSLYIGWCCGDQRFRQQEGSNPRLQEALTRPASSPASDGL